MLRAGFLLTTADRPIETWADPTRGSLRWQSLFSAGATPTDSLTCGVAHVAAGETFSLHSHPQAEVYFGLSGRGTVMVGGQPFELTVGTALFIPGGVEHGVLQADEAFSWFYVFAADSFDEISYRFQTGAPATLQMPPIGLDPLGGQESSP